LVCIEVKWCYLTGFFLTMLWLGEQLGDAIYHHDIKW
jgi:hypothetical protein